MTPESVAKVLIAGETPGVEDMEAYWHATDAGQRPKSETVAVLGALAATGPERARSLSFVRYVDRNYKPIRLPVSERIVNIVGTGGGRSTFNISTTAAFVAAAAGVTVLKSGSSAYSSRVGSGDILGAMGLGQPMSDVCLGAMLEEVGIGFAPASSYAAICKRLAIAALPLPFKVIGRFVNGLGPLICPYATFGGVVGAPTMPHFNIIREVARETGKRILSVHSDHGVDELLSIGTNWVAWPDQDMPDCFNAAEGNFTQGSLEELDGGALAQNARLMQDILQGRAREIPTQTVALNAGAVLYVAEHAASIVDGARIALDCMRDGAPYETFLTAQRFAQRETPAARSAAE